MDKEGVSYIYLRHCIHADTLRDQVLRESSSEADYGTFCGSIVNHACRPSEGYHRCRVYYPGTVHSQHRSIGWDDKTFHIRISPRHMRNRVFGNRERLQDIAPERTLNIIEIDILEVLAHNLLPSIVDQNIDPRIPKTKPQPLALSSPRK